MNSDQMKKISEEQLRLGYSLEYIRGFADASAEHARELDYYKEMELRYNQLLDDTSSKSLERLQEENEKYRKEMDKITNGIPSEWAYAILKKERDELKQALDVALNLIKQIDLTLQVPAAEYVPAIGDAFDLIDKHKQAITSINEILSQTKQGE